MNELWETDRECCAHLTDEMLLEVRLHVHGYSGRTWSKVCLIWKSACLVALLQLCLPPEDRNNPSADGHISTVQVNNQVYSG